MRCKCAVSVGIKALGIWVLLIMACCCLDLTNVLDMYTFGHAPDAFRFRHQWCFRLSNKFVSMAASSSAARKRKADEAFQRKEENRATIADTLMRCGREPDLKRVRRAHVCLLPGAQRRVERSIVPYVARAVVQTDVRDADCVAVARELSQLSGARVWMLNMASPTCPGGGVLAGCNAQEEHLCRCSNLLLHLTRAAVDGCYPLHSGGGEVPDFKILVHKGIVVFKDPEDYVLLSREQRFGVGVLTAAAEKVHGGRSLGRNAFRFIEYLMDVAEMQGGTHLVLSAWGCGAFGQSPLEVAQCFQRVLAQTLGNLQVVFAIKDDHNSEGNLQAFKTVFGK